MTEILDCTFRDGGYYNNWAFGEQLIDKYLKNLNGLPITYAELGYRSVLSKPNAGEFYNITSETIAKANVLMPNVKKAIMLDEKNCHIADLPQLLSPCIGSINMVRVAVSAQHLERGINLLKAIKSFGFTTAMNLLYASEWQTDLKFLKTLKDAHKYADYIYVVDSFGSLDPKEVTALVKALKDRTNAQLGFHGHNNLELALINSIAAADAGCTIIDSTILGMGRGAGNLKTELLLSYLGKTTGLRADYKCLSALVEAFAGLYQEYQWGTNFAYMFSGTHSLHQNEVMSEISNNRLSIRGVIDHLVQILSSKNEAAFKTIA